MHVQKRQQGLGWHWVLGVVLLGLGCGEPEQPPATNLCADVTCAPPQACQQPGVCDPATGQCGHAPLADGTACDDGSACTQTDSCQAGVCAGGNALSCPGVQHTYDTANRLVTTRLADGRTVHYQYDGNGMLVGMLEEDGRGHTKEVELLLDESDSLPRVLGAVDSEGHEALYLFGPEGLQAQARLSGAELKVDYPVVDHQGTVRAVVDGASGQAHASFFEPLGTLRHTTAEQGHPSRFGYTGEPLLPDGNVYLRARVYSPTLGRFLQRDTYPGQFERPQSLNRYAWLEGQVTTLTDPSGHHPFGPGHATTTLQPLKPHRYRAQATVQAYPWTGLFNQLANGAGLRAASIPGWGKILGVIRMEANQLMSGKPITLYNHATEGLVSRTPVVLSKQEVMRVLGSHAGNPNVKPENHTDFREPGAASLVNAIDFQKNQIRIFKGSFKVPGTFHLGLFDTWFGHSTLEVRNVEVRRGKVYFTATFYDLWNYDHHNYASYDLRNFKTNMAAVLSGSPPGVIVTSVPLQGEVDVLKMDYFHNWRFK